MTSLDALPDAVAVEPRRGASAEPVARAWSRRDAAAAIAVLLLVFLAFGLAWPLTGAVVPWDSKNQFYALFRFLGDAMRHGELPLWNPYQYAGYPAVADPQSLVTTPTLLLAALAFPHASMPAFDAFVFAHLLLGGLAMLGLGRRWGWHPLAAILAALVFAFGGPAAARLQHTGMIVSYGFFPPALWALQAAMSRRPMASALPLAVLAGVLAALMALGRDQVAFFFCLTLAGAALGPLATARRPLSELRRVAPVLLVAGLTVLAIMVVPILLTMQFLHESNRPGISYGVALAGSLDPPNLLTLFAPNVFGSLDRIYDYWGPGTTTIFGDNYTDRCTNYLFAGTLPLVLVLWHGVVGGRLGGRGIRAAALVGAAAILFALGRFTPLFGLAFDWVPGVALYRRPADATFLFEVMVAFAAGHLLDRFLRYGLPRLSIARLALVVGGAALLAGAGLSLSAAAGHVAQAIVALADAALAAGLAIAGLAYGERRSRRVLVAATLVTLTAAQLGWRNAASALNAEPTWNYSAFAPTPAQAAGLAALSADMAPRLARGERPRVEFLGLDGSWQNAAMVLKLEAISGYNPLRLGSFSRAVGVGENSDDPRKRSFPDSFRGYNSRLAALLGLDYLVLDRPIAELPRQVPRPHATLLYAGAGIDVYRLDNPAVPRAMVVTSWRLVDGTAALDNGTPPDFRPGEEALVDSRDAALLPPAAPAAGAAKGSAEIVASTNDRVQIAVETPAPGLLVLHDLAYPGWQARLDGAPVPILRADLLFRGIAVPAGHHTVEFSFHPFAPANLAAAAAGLLHPGGG